MKKIVLRAGTAGLYATLLLGGAMVQAQTASKTPGSASTAEVRFDIRAYSVQGNTLLPASTIATILAAHTGNGRSFEDINKVIDALRQAYADAGYPIVQVSVPEQKLDKGTVSLRVVEGRLAKVSITGNLAFDSDNLRASLPTLQEGSLVNTKELIAAIALANESPAKQIAVNFQAGAWPGEVDARIDVTESALETTTVTADNLGSAVSGRTRLGFTYVNANAFNRDHLVGLQYNTTAEQPDNNKNIVLNYHLPIYAWGVSMDWVAAYSDSQSNNTGPLGPIVFSGKGSFVAARLNQPLPGSGELRQKLSYGLDFKDYANACGIAGISLPSCGSITTMPVSLTYSMQSSTPAFQGGASISHARNIPGGRHGSAEEYLAARQGATPNWSATRVSMFAAVPFGSDWQLRGQLAAQFSPDALVSAEQFGIGGSGLRGYEERVAAGDRGYSGSVELYTPQVMPVGLVQLRALAFCDFGSVQKNLALVNETATNLSSWGIGVRLNMGKSFQGRFDIGWTRDAAGSREANQATGIASVSYVY